jgi:hypothetical protein
MEQKDMIDRTALVELMERILACMSCRTAFNPSYTSGFNLALYHVKNAPRVEMQTEALAEALEVQALLAGLVAQATRVKPLVWQEFQGNRLGPRKEADSPVGRYAIFIDGAWFKLTRSGSRIGGAIPTLEAAKAAAQADYEQRIRAAIGGNDNE